MKTYFIDVLLHHYADFSGHATRKQYWLFILWDFIFVMILGILNYFLGSIWGTIGSLFALSVYTPGLAILIRRFRDAGISPFWGLLELPHATSFFTSLLGVNIYGVFSSDMKKCIAGIFFLCAILMLIFCLLPSKK